MSPNSNPVVKPWYREPWPWFLMSGPAIVIVAGLTTAWIAVKSSDGLVSDDYYKQGLVAGETLAKSQHARDLGITAGVRLGENSIKVRLVVQNQAQTGMPERLLATFSHPTRAGIDQKVELLKTDDAYLGKLQLPASGHWLILLEDDQRSWRIMGGVVLPAAGEVMIGGG